MAKKVSCEPIGPDMNGQALSSCDRVEIHPRFDLWMRGAKYGQIVRQVKSGKRKGKLAVRMDHPQVRKLLYATPSDLKKIR